MRAYTYIYTQITDENRSFMIARTRWGLAKLFRVIALDDVVGAQEGSEGMYVNTCVCMCKHAHGLFFLVS